MASQFKISRLNPLHFLDTEFVPLPQYNTRHFDDFDFPDTILSFQQMVGWAQPWQNSDAIRLQFISQVGPINAILIAEDGSEVITQAFQQGQQSSFQPTWYIYQLDLSLAPFPEGFYRLRVDLGSRSLISNLFTISEKVENSVLVDYKHFKYFGDIFFETGFSPMIRIYGSLVYSKPGSRNVVYDNQDLDTTLISAKPFSLWRLYTGGPEGIPDFFIHKLNDIFSVREIRLDGRYYTKATEGSQFEERAEVDYPMRGWSIELRDKLNRRSVVYDNDTGQIVNGYAVVINVEAKGFLSNDAGGSFYDVLDVN